MLVCIAKTIDIRLQLPTGQMLNAKEFIAYELRLSRVKMLYE